MMKKFEEIFSRIGVRAKICTNIENNGTQMD
jgi:hypothetical protein